MNERVPELGAILEAHGIDRNDAQEVVAAYDEEAQKTLKELAANRPPRNSA